MSDQPKRPVGRPRSKSPMDQWIKFRVTADLLAKYRRMKGGAALLRRTIERAPEPKD